MPPPVHPPFWADWTFWSFVIAGIAVLLSQLPPLRDLLAKPRLVLETHGKIQLHHMIGYPNAGLYISLRNLGRKPVRVVGVTLTFSKDDGAPAITMQSTQYFVGPTDSTAVLLVPFTLSRDEEWGHVVTFYPTIARQEDRRLGELRSALRRDIAAKANARTPAQVAADTSVEADEANVAPLRELFRQKFSWVHGEYRVEVWIRTQGGFDVRSRSRMTLWETDEQELRSYVDGYKNGFGPAVDAPLLQPGVYPVLVPET